MTAIHAVGITHTYNGKDIILNGIDLDVEKGEFLSILGASGSGKTTLLSVIGGIETPTSGHVYIDGEDIAAAKEKRRAILRRTKIGFVFQFFNLAPYLNVEQNILVPVLLNGKGKKSVEKELDALLSFVGLEDKAWRSRAGSSSTPTSSFWTSRRATSTPPIPRGSCVCFHR